MKNRRYIRLIGLALCAVMLCTGALAEGIEAGITLPKGLSVIEEAAFAGTTGMETVVIQENAKRIESRAFANSSVREVYIPESVEYIADDAFEGCKNLTLVVHKGSYAHRWLVGQNVNYRLIEDEEAALKTFDVSGVCVFTQADEAGETQMFAGATVTAGGACGLVINVLDEESEETLLTASMDVPAGTKEESLQIPVEWTMPEYYILEAALVDESGEVICECRNNTATSAYSAFEARTISDYADEYASERIVDFGDSGFAVLADGVIVLNASAAVDGGSYTFETNKGLKPGDLVLLDAAGTSTVIKIASIRENSDGTVTVTKDENVSLGEMYDVLKVDANMVGSASPAGEGIDEVVPVFSLDHTLGVGAAELSSHSEMTLHVKFDYDKHFLDDYNLQVTAHTSGTIGVSLGGEVDTFKTANPPAIEVYASIVTIPGIPVPGVLRVNIPINFKANGKGTATLGFDNTYGFTFSEANGFVGTKSGDSHADMGLDCNFEIFVGPQVSLSLSLFEALQARIGAQFGPRVTGELITPKYGGTTADEPQRHACAACVDMDVYATANIRGTVLYDLGDWVSGTLVDMNIAAYNKKLGDAYYSAINDKESIYKGEDTFGWGECKNLKYRVIADAEDMNGNAVNGAPMSIRGSKTPGITGVSPMKTYLYPGDYTATADFDGNTANETFYVRDRAQTVTVVEPESVIKGAATDAATGQGISGVEVILALPDGTTRKTATKADGSYTFDKLRVGVYDLYFSKTGFGTIEKPETGVNAGETKIVNVSMKGQLTPIYARMNYAAYSNGEYVFTPATATAIEAGGIVNQEIVLSCAESDRSQMLKCKIENRTLGTSYIVDIDAYDSSKYCMSASVYGLDMGDGAYTYALTLYDSNHHSYCIVLRETPNGIVPALDFMYHGHTDSVYGADGENDGFVDYSHATPSHTGKPKAGDWGIWSSYASIKKVNGSYPLNIVVQEAEWTGGWTTRWRVTTTYELVDGKLVMVNQTM